MAHRLTFASRHGHINKVCVIRCGGGGGGEGQEWGAAPHTHTHTQPKPPWDRQG